MAKLWRDEGRGVYRRLYRNLTQKELLALIRDANLFRWRQLDLSCCGLDTLPEELGDLPELVALDMGNAYSFDHGDVGDVNSFTALPESIGKLSKLTWLDLRYTQITTLPESIGKLSNLYSLNLAYTQITALPENIGKHFNLKWLYLSHTKIITLPESFGNLSNLERLYLGGTPLAKKIPPEILNQSPQEIIRYVLEMQSKAEKKYLLESKMVVVGQGEVGKSCVINRLLHDKYTAKLSTEGIDIAPWQFQGADKEKYTLHVWDFGGQEIYHATHQFFITRRTLYLLVWSVLAEKDDGRLEYWLRTVQSRAGDSPIILIVNKCDKNIKRYKRVDSGLLERFPQVKDVFYVSCKDNIRIAELRNYIQYEAEQLPLMRTQWFESWVAVRRTLEKMAAEKNYIGYGDYEDICGEKGIAREEALSLAKYLHDLGIILYFHEDSLLGNLVILSPEWGTDAVYKVLDEQEGVLKGRNGVLFFSDLPKIWKDSARYPRDRYPHLLKLMENFQLAFPLDIPGCPKDTYLVAELLNEDPVKRQEPWPPDSAESLAFRYTYDFLPAGVMTRFIVAVHAYLETADGVKQCWRKGAYLHYGEAQARIVLHDFGGFYLDIRVKGDSPRDRQRLLTIIREKVDFINSSYQKIEITEQVPCKCPQCLRSEKPHYFKYGTLLKAESIKHENVECPESLEQVSVASLLDGVEFREKDGETMGKAHREMVSIENSTVIWNESPGERSVIRNSIGEPQKAETEQDNNGEKLTPEDVEHLENARSVRIRTWLLLAAVLLVAAAAALHPDKAVELLADFWQIFTG